MRVSLRVSVRYLAALLSCLACEGQPSSETSGAAAAAGTAGSSTPTDGSPNSHGGGGTSGDGGTGAGSSGRPGEGDIPRLDITPAILENRDLTLTGDAVIKLPPGTSTYTGVISGQGTVRLMTADGTCTPSTWVITRRSTFTLPPERQQQVITKAGPWPSLGYRLDISGTNPPVLIVDPCVTFQIGTNTPADDNPNIIATSDSKNAASLVNDEINLDNIENNGLIALASSQFILLGIISGSGSLNQLPDVWGGDSLRGTSSFAGVLALTTGHDFGSNRVAPGLSRAKAVINEGSWLVWSPANNVLTVTQNIYEAAYGGDINFHPTGNARIVMSGVYSHTDNSPHNTPNLDNPELSDPSLNLAKVIYRKAMTVNGNDASYRGVNIEGGGTVQWGDGTHDRFFLPSAPSPAVFDPPLGKKNAYINLHNGATLAFNYNGPVTLNIGITGGGGGPNRSGAVGVGNVTVMGTAGNDVTFAQPQDYNGTTTIASGATLRLGAGAPVPLDYVTLTDGVKTVEHVADYDGDSSLLTADSSRGDAADKIVNDGTLIVQNTTLPITLSHMSGSGKLVQAGPAVVTVMANTHAGGTWVEAGTLLVGDDHALGGGDVVNHATLAPAKAGVIHIRGNYRQGERGRLRLQADLRARRALVEVDGRAELAGSLEIASERALRVGQRIVLLRAKGGVQGRFGTVSAPGFELETIHAGDACYVFVTGVSAKKRQPAGVSASSPAPLVPPLRASTAQSPYGLVSHWRSGFVGGRGSYGRSESLQIVDGTSIH